MSFYMHNPKSIPWRTFFESRTPDADNPPRYFWHVFSHKAPTLDVTAGDFAMASPAGTDVTSTSGRPRMRAAETASAGPSMRRLVRLGRNAASPSARVVFPAASTPSHATRNARHANMASEEPRTTTPRSRAKNRGPTWAFGGLRSKASAAPWTMRG